MSIEKTISYLSAVKDITVPIDGVEKYVSKIVSNADNPILSCVVWSSNCHITYYRSADSLDYVDEEFVDYGGTGKYYDIESSPQDKFPLQIGRYFRTNFDTPLTEITRDITATMQYVRKYLISFKDYDTGIELSNAYLIGNIGKGTSQPYPNVSKDYYTFQQWYPESFYVNRNYTILAKFKKNIINILGFRNTYKFIGTQRYEFEVLAELNNNSEIDLSQGGHIEYKTEGGQWGFQKIYTSGITPNPIKVYYRITYSNYETVEGFQWLTVTEKSVYQVTFHYRAQTENWIQTTQSVIEGDDAIPPSLEYELNGWKFEGWNKSYEKISDDTDIYAKYSEKILSCNIFSSQYYNHELQTTNYGHTIHPTLSNDGESPTTRWKFKRWYSFDEKFEKTSFNTEEFERYIYPNLSVAPEYVQLFYLSVFNVTYTTYLNKIYSQVEDGSDMLSQDIDISISEKEEMDYEFDKFIPTANSWNPITDNTAISAIYIYKHALQYELYTKDKNGTYISSYDKYHMCTENNDDIIYDEIN